MKTVNLVLVGIGGYASLYVDTLLDNPAEGVEIAGMVDPFPNSCRRLAELKAKGIPLYDSMEAFYREHEADLAVITTPIQFHTEHILTALSHGSNVLCEKPLCGDANDIEVIEAASKKAGRFVDIGYQWSHNPGILKMKEDIISGLYGKALSLKSITLWPRNAAYFKRGCGWAGKFYDSEGRAIFDSVASNATAHYLHNIFFVCGREMNSSASPISFEATLLRTNPIETFDTCILTGTLDNGAEIRYIASHAVEKVLNPVCEYTFEKGTITYSSIDGGDMAESFVGKLNDGTVIDYGNPFEEVARKMWLCIDDARDGRLGNECCPVAAAAVHTRVINKLLCEPKIFPSRQSLTEVLGEGDEGVTYVKDLYQALVDAYNGGSIDLSAFTE